ncbi:pro-MCH isoform X1 [Podarcis raffonei]|uniref:pro-MCH isoform X1 n=2 Tax=Podarcis raffonei TaxID=65483 RepID=UPI00232922FB|nr:pro-MCH isoform X1 [Podarcis raffonei]
MQTLKHQRMCSSSYALILIFSLFSQGFFLSVSKSMRKAEDDMLLSTFTLGKVIQNGGKAEKAWPASSLEHYKMEDNSFLDEEEDGAPKFSNINPKHHAISHGQPMNLDIKQLPYFALEGPMTFPSDAEVQNIQSVQQRRETEDDENSAKLPIGRRDFDMLRCMLGRVYRPCWQV